MAGALRRCLNASAMNCQVVTTTLKLHSYVSSPPPAHPRLRPCGIGNWGIRLERTVLFEQGVRLQERGHRALKFHRLFCCLANRCRHVPNTPHPTAALTALRSRDLWPSLRRPRTWLQAATSNCGIRVHTTVGLSTEPNTAKPHPDSIECHIDKSCHSPLPLVSATNVSTLCRYCCF